MIFHYLQNCSFVLSYFDKMTWIASIGNNVFYNIKFTILNTNLNYVKKKKKNNYT